MRSLSRATVIVPCRDEEEAVPEVVAELLAAGVAEVIVVDNGSHDATAVLATRAGARVVSEPRAGYGWACLAGVRAAGHAELVGFIDGDGSFAVSDLERLASLVTRGDAALALGARRGTAALPLHQRAGNSLVLAGLRALYGLSLPDLGPLRVLRGDVLRDLDMRGSRYAWLVEMLCKASRRSAAIVALPVEYGPRRGGTSKVTGSLRGSLLAGVDFARALWELRAW